MARMNLVGVLITVVFAAILVPIAVAFWNGANQTGWTSEEKTLWTLGPIFIILGVVVAIVALAIGKKEGYF